MLRELGRVISVDYDGVWVETLQKSSCDQCSARSGCGQRLLADSALKNMSAIKALYSSKNNCILKVGDQVEIGITENALVSAALLVYMLPLVMMVCGALIGSIVFTSSVDNGVREIFTPLFALVGLALGGFAVRWHSVKHRNSNKFHAVVLEPSVINNPTALHCL